jgi:hypothetical protein
MKKLVYFSLLLMVASLLVVACKDDSDEIKDPGLVAGTGKLLLQFDNVVGNQDLVLDNKTYTNSFGESLTISRFNYFVSNIKLLREDGQSYTIPLDSSYFRIVESDPKSQTVSLNNLPDGNYSGVEYIIGVDSLRSVSGIEKRGGALDPSGEMSGDGMYWAWNSGYIFLKLEGASPQSSASNGKFYYHIGLFGGFNEKTVNNIKTVKIDFGGNKAVVKGDSIPQVKLYADVEKVYNGPNPISFDKNPSIMADPVLSVGVANNYKSMFSFGELKQNSQAK